jgi:outer membrane protein
MQYKFYVILLIAVFGVTFSLKAQKVGFISSDDIRKNFPEAKQADQRIQSIVEEWKRELQSIEDNIRMLEDEIKKNRLVWTDDERASNENELNELKKLQKTFAKEKFEVGGEYDKAVQMLMSKIEEKIYAATQEVAADEGFDIVFDKSVQPLPYVNFKYDLTVKVLRKLGVDTKKLEEELDAKISKDPRNNRMNQDKRHQNEGVKAEAVLILRLKMSQYLFNRLKIQKKIKKRNRFQLRNKLF